jgi:hypothetical protein
MSIEFVNLPFEISQKNEKPARASIAIPTRAKPASKPAIAGWTFY